MQVLQALEQWEKHEIDRFSFGQSPSLFLDEPEPEHRGHYQH